MSVSVDLTPPAKALSAAELIDLARNPEKYQAVADDIERRKAELRQLIEAVGPVETINALRSDAESNAKEARSALVEARQQLADAKSESERILAEARAEAQRQLDEAARRSEAMTQKAAASAADAESRTRAAGERHARLDIREDAIAQKEQALASERGVVAALRTTLGKKAAAAKALAAGLAE